jgi:hypothetical protein
MSRRKYRRRTFGRVRRMNCVVAMLSLLIAGRLKSLYVRRGWPPHLVGLTRRGHFIEFGWAHRRFCWYLLYEGVFWIGHPRLVRTFHTRIW